MPLTTTPLPAVSLRRLDSPIPVATHDRQSWPQPFASAHTGLRFLAVLKQGASIIVCTPIGAQRADDKVCQVGAEHEHAACPYDPQHVSLVATVAAGLLSLSCARLCQTHCCRHAASSALRCHNITRRCVPVSLVLTRAFSAGAVAAGVLRMRRRG